MHTKTKNMSLCAMMAVLMCICAWISIPAPIAFTMQSFALFALLLMLGGRLGLITVLLYLSMGAIGLPVFHGFQGGVGILFGATGGYLLAFVPAAGLYWLCSPKSRWGQFFCLFGGLLLCYAIGTAWYALLYAELRSTWAILSLCVLPFIVPDMAKLALAMYLSKALGRHMV